MACVFTRRTADVFTWTSRICETMAFQDSDSAFLLETSYGRAGAHDVGGGPRTRQQAAGAHHAPQVLRGHGDVEVHVGRHLLGLRAHGSRHVVTATSTGAL